MSALFGLFDFGDKKVTAENLSNSKSLSNVMIKNESNCSVEINNEQKKVISAIGTDSLAVSIGNTMDQRGIVDVECVTRSTNITDIADNMRNKLISEGGADIEGLTSLGIDSEVNTYNEINNEIIKKVNSNSIANLNIGLNQSQTNIMEAVDGGTAVQIFDDMNQSASVSAKLLHEIINDTSLKTKLVNEAEAKSKLDVGLITDVVDSFTGMFASMYFIIIFIACIVLYIVYTVMVKRKSSKRRR